MAIWKCTALFQQTTNAQEANGPHRVGGWSESLYYDGAFNTAADKFFRNADSYCAKRAAMFPVGVAIVGERIQGVNPVTASQSFAKGWVHAGTIAEDVPQMALYLRVHATATNNTRQLILRGMPDGNVVDGEFVDDPNMRDAVNALKTTLSQFKFRGIDLTQPKVDIDTVSAAGLVTTLAPHGLVVGDVVRISRVFSLLRLRTVSHVAKVLTQPTDTTFTVGGWTHGDGRNGTTRKQVIIYPSIDGPATEVRRITVRKVGRPFDLYRGRR